MSSPTNPETPRLEYERRLQRRAAVLARLQVTDARLSTARGVCFFAAVALLAAGSAMEDLPMWSAAAPAGLFVVLVVWHQRIADALRRAERAVGHYQIALNRCDELWRGIGPSGERYLSGDHLYAGDLDIFGDGSLFQLLCRARTRLGEDRLAEWLLGGAAVGIVRQRQSAVTELRGAVDLREQLAVLDEELHEALDQNQLLAWSQQPPQPFHWSVRVTAAILSGLAVAAIFAWLFLGLRLVWVIAAALLMAAFLFVYRSTIRRLAAQADDAGSGLAILSAVLRVIERQEPSQPHLRAMRDRLQTEGRPPSRQIARLGRSIRTLNNALRNQFFALFGFLFALPVHLIHSIETWRDHVGEQIPDWLDVVAEFEALVSLSGFAYENPDAVFPEFAENGPLFRAEKLGHPLLPREDCVRNDVSLGDGRRLILISGSNMSGKSTLLRTVGVNAVLAQAGAPVRVDSLQLSPLQVATAMRIQDSLQDGRSLFYTVLRRIKAIVDAAGQSPPLLFLLDEILQGTNSHDRRIGAEGVIRTLMERGCLGLVTTHDLALTEIISTFDGEAVNCHFQDEISDGRMTFDYRLRPGIVEKSNALELMRSMGLEV